MNSPSGRRSVPATFWAALLLAVVLGSVYLDEPLWGSEGRFSVVAREMGESGDLLRMTIGGVPYPDKPFGSYWLILLASRLAGGEVTERVARLPSVVAYLLSVWLVFAIGRRTVGDRAGAVAALLLATSARILYWSRTASADSLGMLGAAAAALLVLEASERPRWRHLPLLGVVAAASSLLKGLSGVAVPAFVALTWALAVRGFRWIRPGPAAIGLAAFVLTLGAPFAVAILGRGDWGPLDLLWRESVVRAVDPFDHVKPVWFYVVNQFDLLAPWALLLPAALVAAFGAVAARARENGRWSFRMFDDEERRRRVFPLFVFLSIFLFFTISRSRRTYYLMPAAPFACLVIATFLDGPARGAALFLKRVGLALLGAMGVVAGAVVLVAGSLALLTPAPPTWLPGAERIPPEAWAAVPFWLPLLGVAILPGVLLLRRLRADRGLIRPAVALAAIVAFAMAGLRAELRGATDSLPGFCEQVREFVPPGVLISREEGGDAKLVHYLDRPTVSEKVSVEKYRVVTARRAEGILSREPGAWTVPLRERRWRPPGSPDKGSGYVLLVAR